jgi:hypothetical protein
MRLRLLIPFALALAVAGSITGTQVFASSQSFDLNTAYHSARAGDTVCIPAGHYSGQSLTMDSSKPTAGPPVTFTPCGGPVIFDNELTFGTGCSGANNPYQIVLDGGPNRDFQIGDRTHESDVNFCSADASPVSDITFNHWKIGNNMPSTGGATMSLKSARRVTIENSIIGPSCCGSPGGTSQDITFGIGSNGQANPTDNVIANNTFYGNQRYGSAWNGAYSNLFGTPPGSDCNPSTCHGDLIHSFGNVNIQILNNKFFDGDTQGLYFENINGGSEQSGTICGNWFGPMSTEPSPYGQGVSEVTGDLVGPGTWLICFNTMVQAHWRLTYGPAGGFTAHGETVKFIGNLGGDLYGHDLEDEGFPGGCGKNSGVTFIHKFNIRPLDNQGTPAVCDPTDASVPNSAAIDSLLVNTSGDASKTDLHLASTSSLPNGFVTGAGLCTLNPVDLDGDVRPATGCNAGADQTSGGPPPPQPPPPPPPPPPLTAPVLSCAASPTYTLIWPAVSGATSYQLYLDGTLVSSTGGMTAKYGNLPCGQHTLGVAAKNANGSSTIATKTVP